LEDLQVIVEMTIKPVEVYNFTYHFVPITIPELGIEDLNSLASARFRGFSEKNA